MEGIIGKGEAKKHVERMCTTWSCVGRETQGARLRGEEMNNKEDMEMNGLTDGD